MFGFRSLSIFNSNQQTQHPLRVFHRSPCIPTVNGLFWSDGLQRIRLAFNPTDCKRLQHLSLFSWIDAAKQRKCRASDLEYRIGLRSITESAESATYDVSGLPV